MERLVNAPSGKQVTDKIQEIIKTVNTKGEEYEGRIDALEEVASQTHIVIVRHGANDDAEE